MTLTVAQLNKQLKEKAKGLYLFYGEENFLHSTYINRIKKSVLDGPFADFNYSVFDEKSAVFENFISEINTYPQMANQKLIVLKNTDFLTLAEYQKKMADVLNDLPDYAVIIFIEHDTKKIKKDLLKLIQANGTSVEFTKQSVADLRSWVNRTFAAADKRMKIEDMEHLVNICERSLDRLSTECAKLIAAVGDSEVITRRNINDMVQIPLEFKIYTMADKLLSGNPEGAYTMLRELKINKEQPTVIIALIYSQLSSLYMFRQLRQRGEEFIPSSRRFLAKKYASECMRHDEKKLRTAMIQCAEFDDGIKNGTIDGWTALELVMAFLLQKNYKA